MTDEELFKYSRSLSILKLMVNKLDNLHIKRYAYLVENSQKGTACTYAIATKKMIPSESDEYLSILNDIEEAINYYKKTYVEEINVKKEKRKEG